jgi:hypothetical protein
MVNAVSSPDDQPVRPLRLDHLRHHHDPRLTTYVRKELSVPRQRVNAMGYWRTAG